MGLEKVVSGGQTGADRAALDAALDMGLSHGGWLPRGRRTEDGALDARYRLCELPSRRYPPRTERNVLDSDATLIVSHGALRGGSALTRTLARRHGRPWLHVDLTRTTPLRAALTVCAWLAEHDVRCLNVAGPRASEDAAIYRCTRTLVTLLILIRGGMPADP